MRYRYLDEIRNILNDVEQNEWENIEKIVEKMTETILHKHSIFSFGCSHAGMLTEELYYRAGGLMNINPVFCDSLLVSTSPAALTSRLERLEGFGSAVAGSVPFQKGDLLIIHSVSGRNAFCLDFAQYAREKGVFIVCLTSLAYASAVASRHSSGKKLHEISDLVLDNHGSIGDACIKIEGLEQRVGASSTIIGLALFNEIVVQVTERLIQRGMTEPPVYYSVNLDGGEEHNRRLKEYFQDNIYY